MVKTIYELEPYRKLRRYLQQLITGNSHGLVIKSIGGTGKSRLTEKELQENGTDYVIINSYVTPMELYNLIYQNRNMIIMFDDTEDMIKDNKIIGMLKGALQSNFMGKRIVSYHSSRLTEGLPAEFEFTGKIVILTNQSWADNDSVRALMSRVMVYDMQVKYETFISYMKWMANNVKYEKLTKEQRLECIEFIENVTDETFPNFNLRKLIKVYECMTYDENDWRLPAIDELTEGRDNPANRKLQVIKKVVELLESKLTVKEQIKEFEKIGMHRSYYFKIKKGFEK